jgi:hypothetical protein
MMAGAYAVRIGVAKVFRAQAAFINDAAQADGVSLPLSGFPRVRLASKGADAP